MNTKLILIFFLITIFTSSCSYQKMNSIDQKRFDIQEFEVTGGARESFVLQKKIQRFSNKDSKNKIKILIDLSKDKAIKEKNIQNKVIKYNLSLSANIKIIELNTSREIKRNLTFNEVYDVGDSYSITVNNSKEANNSLIDKMVNEILDQLRIYYN